MAKKSKGNKSKNLAFPILAISVSTTLALSLYLARPRTSPVGINEVAGVVSNCAQVNFADNFSGTTLDSTKWFSWSETGGTATVNNGLTLTVPADKTNGSVSISTANKVALEGDFIIETTINSLSTTPSSSMDGSAAIDVYSLDWKNWYRLEAYRSGDIQTYSTTNSVTTAGTVVNAFKNTPTKLKIIRSGTTITTYFDTGSGYTQHTQFTNIYPGTVYIQHWALSHNTDKPAVSAVFRDFSLKCRPAAPTNLQSSCSSDGTKATITWDAVQGSNVSYDLRFDDTSNNSTSCRDGWYCENSKDFLKDAQTTNSYTTAVTPNTDYSWWVHTRLGIDGTILGIDGSSAAGSQFKCTPKPSAPTNPTIACASDGKSARLMWDGITDAESYKVRLDDKNGHVTNYDDIKQLQYIVGVTPDKAYSFWVHTHKGSLDSNQSTAIDFTCKASSTSTPTPTVKPSIKPSPKPTTQATSTPIIAPTSSPTNPSYVPPLDANPSPSTSAKVTTNPIARFFTWLASLFE